ncbi:9271_t:CDS:2, partial [Funneliformis mosseae]
ELIHRYPSLKVIHDQFGSMNNYKSYAREIIEVRHRLAHFDGKDSLTETDIKKMMMTEDEFKLFKVLTNLKQKERPLIRAQSNIANTTKKSLGKASTISSTPFTASTTTDDQSSKQEQRLTRSGRKVADYNEQTSDSSEYSLDINDDDNIKEFTIATSKSTNRKNVEASYEDFVNTLNFDNSPDEQESLQKRLGFPIFTKKFLNYDQSKRTQQRKLEKENKTTSMEIDNLREKIQKIKSKNEVVTKESNEKQELNNELRDYIEKIKSSLFRLEKEIGPTVMSSSVKLDDTENMDIYVNEFRKRIVGGCLLQPE